MPAGYEELYNDPDWEEYDYLTDGHGNPEEFMAWKVNGKPNLFGGPKGIGEPLPMRQNKENAMSEVMRSIPQIPEYRNREQQESVHPKNDPEAYRSDWNYSDDDPFPSYSEDAPPEIKRAIDEFADSTVSGDDLHMMMTRRAAIDPIEFQNFLMSDRGRVALDANIPPSQIAELYQEFISEQDQNPAHEFFK